MPVRSFISALSVAILILLSVQGERACALPEYFAETGHWYEAVQVTTGTTWLNAKAAAENRGGYLATSTSTAENQFIFSLVNTAAYWTSPATNGHILGPWLGGFTQSNVWTWVTGEAFSFTAWVPGQPDAYGGGIQNLILYSGTTRGSTWGDAAGNGTVGFDLPRGYVVEYDTSPI